MDGVVQLAVAFVVDARRARAAAAVFGGGSAVVAGEMVVGESWIGIDHDPFVRALRSRLIRARPRRCCGTGQARGRTPLGRPVIGATRISPLRSATQQM